MSKVTQLATIPSYLGCHSPPVPIYEPEPEPVCKCDPYTKFFFLVLVITTYGVVFVAAIVFLVYQDKGTTYFWAASIAVSCLALPVFSLFLYWIMDMTYSCVLGMMFSQ